MNTNIKEILNESVSQIVFHFTTLTNLYSMCCVTDGKIALSVATRPSDVRMSTVGDKKYPYYLSLTRSPSSMQGYVYMRYLKTGGEWSGALVRLEMNSRLLNSDFKGAPVNYYNELHPLDFYIAINDVFYGHGRGTKYISKNDIFCVDLNGIVYKLVGKELEQVSNNVNQQVLYIIRNTKYFKRLTEGNAAISDYAKGRTSWYGDFDKYSYGKQWDNFRAIPNSNDKAIYGRGRLKRNSFELPNDFIQRNKVESERNRMREYEDRVYSDSNVMDIERYVERIDIYIPREIISGNKDRRKSYYIYSVLGALFRSKFANKIFVYDNLVGFNSVNIRNSINLGNFKNKNYAPIDMQQHINNGVEGVDYNRKVADELNNDDIKFISKYISFLAYFMVVNKCGEFRYNSFDGAIGSICRALGLHRWLSYDGIISYTSKIKQESWTFYENVEDFNNAYFSQFSWDYRNYKSTATYPKMKLLSKMDSLTSKLTNANTPSELSTIIKNAALKYDVYERG